MLGLRMLKKVYIKQRLWKDLLDEVTQVFAGRFELE